MCNGMGSLEKHDEQVISTRWRGEENRESQMCNASEYECQKL